MEDANFLYGRDTCCKVAGKIIRKGKFTSKVQNSMAIHIPWFVAPFQLQNQSFLQRITLLLTLLLLLFFNFKDVVITFTLCIIQNNLPILRSAGQHMCAVAQLCSIHCDPMNCNLSGSSVQSPGKNIRLPVPFPGDLPDSGIEPTSLSPVLAGSFFTTASPGKLCNCNSPLSFNIKQEVI